MGYDAFISYSHAADGLLAPRLQEALQRFAKPWWRRRALHIFRDETGLFANPGLWTSITAAMDESDYFVLLASPDAAESVWVNREVEYWRAHKDPSHILPVVTDGEWAWDEAATTFTAASTAAPAALIGAFVEEPRHIDMRWARADDQLDLRNGRFRDQVAELAAPIHGMAKDDLAGLDVKQHRRTLRTAWGAAIALVALTLLAGSTAVIAARNADEASAAERRADIERDQARIGRLVAESASQLDSDLDLAFLLAVEARRRADTPATRGALFTALTHNLTSERLRPGASPYTAGAIHVTNSSLLGFLAGPPRIQNDVDISDDARVVAGAGTGEGGDGGLVLVYDTTTRKEIARITDNTAFWTVDVSADGREVLAQSGESIFLLDTTTRTTRTLSIQPPPNEVFEAAFLEPGTARAVVLTSDGVLRAWDRVSDTPAESPVSALLIDSVGFAPDGSLFVKHASAELSFFEARTDRLLRTVLLQNAPSDIAWLSVTADGARVVGGEPQGRLFVWDSVTGAQVGDPAVRPGTVRGLATSRTGAATVAVGSAAGGVSLYDLASERVIGDRLYGQAAGTRALAYSADGTLLVSVADDGTIALWGATDAPGLVSRPVAPGVTHPVLPEDGDRVLVLSSQRPEIRSVTAPTIAGLPLEVGPTSWAELSRDGSSVLIADGTASVSDTTTGHVRWTLADPDFSVVRGDLNANGSVVVLPDDHRLRLRAWDVSSNSLLGSVSWSDLSNAPGDFFTGRPRFNGDGSAIDIPVGFGVVRFNATDLSPVQQVRTSFVVGDVESVPGTDHVIAAGVGGQVARVDMVTGQVVAEGRSADPSGIGTIAVSRDGSMVVVYHALSYQLTLFDGATLQPLGKPFPVSDYIFEPHFSADGSTVVGNGLLNGWTEWDVDPDSWEEQTCLAAGRNLTRAEWDEYLGADEPYRPTCARWN